VAYEQLITDRLRDNLTRLNLNRASEVLQSIAEQAEADKRSYLSFWTSCWRRKWPSRRNAASRPP